MDDGWSFGRSRFFRGRNSSTSGRVAFHAPATIVHVVSSNRETLHCVHAAADSETNILAVDSSRKKWAASEHIFISAFWPFAPLMSALLSVSCTTVPPNLKHDCGRHGWQSWRSGFSPAKRPQGDSHCKPPAWSSMFYLFLHGFSQVLWLLPPTVQTHTGQPRTLNSKVGVSANGCLSVLVSLRQRGSSNPVTLS